MVESKHNQVVGGVLQIRYRDDALRTTCNQYLNAYPVDYYRVVVFLTGPEKADVRRTVAANEVVFLDLDRAQLKGLRRYARSQLSQIIARVNPTLILAHRWKATTIAVAALKALSANNIRVFSVVHALNQLHSHSRRLVGRFFLKQQCRFIGVSEAVRDDILDAGFGLASEDVLALPNAIDIDKTRATLFLPEKARQSLGLPLDVPVIGHVGRLVGAKDQKTLISAFALIQKSLPAVRLVIIGAGRLEADLKALLKSLQIADDKVIFAGARSDAVCLMPAFDIFALTSVAEGFPRVLLEALLCKIPIVATDSGGIREVLGSEAQLCQAGDIDGISRYLIEALQLNQTARQKVGDDGYERLRKNFASEIFQKRLLAFTLDF
ncbi:glycosyltransferase [bacterium]|nr:glycosyltransferase [bacterium]